MGAIDSMYLLILKKNLKTTYLISVLTSHLEGGVRQLCMHWLREHLIIIKTSQSQAIGL